MTSTLRQFHALRPFGGFDLIMADPPWSYEMRTEKGEGKSPQSKYACMSIDEIRELPVSALAAKDSLLWLWGLNTMLPQALSVIQAWGFEYKTGGHWVKMTKNGKLNMGTGYLLRGAGEPFLIATRGAPKTTKGVRSVIVGQIREHSRKPEEAFAAAEKLMPHARRIEVFSRQKRAGWSNWGNETEKFKEAV
ncbi:MT-A70 family methyltransferase [Paracoccus tibetensis]|uniref:N6-adenosine-specific RNA methylase IME4 n=1 Tax=Paracoccus tibetensis TaxID=336292 RepID=A0A1G5BGE6_9RHOB|nr:MT-A70 family methyltransferase [Paracoccus tibetensis]SCX89253.1 N6-adenosine-specific RNA methylase IME4 [Paracoccus tibetensis]